MGKKLGQDESALHCARIAIVLARMDRESSIGQIARRLAKGLGTTPIEAPGTPSAALRVVAGFTALSLIEGPKIYTLEGGERVRFVMERDGAW